MCLLDDLREAVITTLDHPVGFVVMRTAHKVGLQFNALCQIARRRRRLTCRTEFILDHILSIGAGWLHPYNHVYDPKHSDTVLSIFLVNCNYHHHKPA